MKDDPPNTAHQSTLSQATETSKPDPIAHWDAERRRCPVAHTTSDEVTEWMVYGHPEALTVLHDHMTYSSRVSTHLSVPSGMDPPEHSHYRTIIDRYFTPEAMKAFEPACREVAAEVIEAALARGGGEAQADLGEPCAVRMQCAFMGWPLAMRDELTAWQDANEKATRARDKVATAAVAETFESHVKAILAERRTLGETVPDDPTTRLLSERVHGRLLTDTEIISIVRNWTVGELGSIAASIGILVYALAQDPALQARLRQDMILLPGAIDEILRVRGPLVANRRVATRDTELGGQRIKQGDRLRILWPALNRDGRVFKAPNEVRLDRNPSANLLYGAGIHVCPGAPLARLELRVFTEELLQRSAELKLDPAQAPVVAVPPKGGFERVNFQIAR